MNNDFLGWVAHMSELDRIVDWIYKKGGGSIGKACDALDLNEDWLTDSDIDYIMQKLEAKGIVEKH